MDSGNLELCKQATDDRLAHPLGRVSKEPKTPVITQGKQSRYPISRQSYPSPKTIERLTPMMKEGRRYAVYPITKPKNNYMLWVM